MTKVAELRHNATTNKWEASYAGQVFLKSTSKDYVVDKIVNQISEKAKKLGITDYVEVGAAPAGAKREVNPELQFSIDERFDILTDFVTMVAKRNVPSAVITGSGGLGKTHTVLAALAAAGLKNIDDLEVGAVMDEALQESTFLMVKGFSTAKALYRTLYENQNRVIVFDDCDSIQKDADAVNILKAALDSYESRTISWNSESPFGKEDALPRSFKFYGGVVFISNLPMYKVPQALISRCLAADVSMTREEIIQRMTTIVKAGEFLPAVDMEVKLECLEYLAEVSKLPEVQALNLRSLIKTVNIRLSVPSNWKRRALYSLLNDR